MAYRVTVSGSFGRHWDEIRRTIQELRKEGADVLSPRDSQPLDTIHGFVLLDGDEGSPADLERAHLEAIGASDLLYVVNPEGYVGPSTSLEIGFALARSIPVWAQVRPASPPHDELVLVGAVAKALASLQTGQQLPRRLDLAALQRRLVHTATARGFGGEGAQTLLVLLMEELGELARAVRMLDGVARADGEGTRVEADAVDAEVADCLIYLLLLADRLEVDAEQAVRVKESRNTDKYPYFPRAGPGS